MIKADINIDIKIKTDINDIEISKTLKKNQWQTTVSLIRLIKLINF